MMRHFGMSSIRFVSPLPVAWSAGTESSPVNLLAFSKKMLD